MLIINADDYGCNQLVTERIVSCYKRNRVTSVSAMVFMEDSKRAAELAREIHMDVGLHLNFTQMQTERVSNTLIHDYQSQIVDYLSRNKYSFLLYNPSLRIQYEYVFRSQLEEFERLYRRTPSHIDGHHHTHLSANMLIQSLIPKGLKIRRNFTYSRGERSIVNRMYRRFIDTWLAKRYMITDYLYSLSECLESGRLSNALAAARFATVELETHPERGKEYDWLMGDAFEEATRDLPKGSFAHLKGYACEGIYCR